MRYRTVQNFGGRKFWQNNSHQKLVDNILQMLKIAEVPKINNYALICTSQMES